MPRAGHYPRTGVGDGGEGGLPNSDFTRLAGMQVQLKRVTINYFSINSFCRLCPLEFTFSLTGHINIW